MYEMNMPGSVTLNVQRASYVILITVIALRIADLVRRKENWKHETDYFYVHTVHSD
jgi:hypothetical protein